MAFTTPEVAIRGIIARLGLIKQTHQITTGTDFWDRVDAGADATYENRVKGTQMTAVDTAFTAGDLGDNSAYQALLSLHNSYITQDLSLTGWDAYLTAAKWRVNQEFADMYYEWSNGRLTVANVAPYDNVDRGNFIHGGSFVDGTHVDSTYTGPGGIKAVVAVKGAADWDLDITVTFDEAETATVVPYTTNETYSLRIAGSAPVGTEYILGEVLMRDNEAIGQTVIRMEDDLDTINTTPFYAGQTVLLYDDSSQEVGIVDSVQAGVSITLTTGIKHAYTTAANAAVRGLYHHITTVATDAGGNGSDRVNFFTQADTTLAL